MCGDGNGNSSICVPVSAVSEREGEGGRGKEGHSHKIAPKSVSTEISERGREGDGELAKDLCSLKLTCFDKEPLRCQESSLSPFKSAYVRENKQSYQQTDILSQEALLVHTANEFLTSG
jgi:hypothetical protein